MSALDVQVGGSHYKNNDMQPIELIVALNLNFIEGNIVKYITRYKNKNGMQDVMKCIHYSQLAIELGCIRPNADIHNNYGIIDKYCKLNNFSNVQNSILIACLQNDYNQVKMLCDAMVDGFNNSEISIKR